MKKIAVGMTGATGAIYGIRLLERLKEHGAETHLVISEWGKKSIELETDWTVAGVNALADAVYEPADMGASISSGSFLLDAVVIAPCTMKTLAAIRIGFTNNLICRAADVAMKEQRKLILLPRETPLNTVHLENMYHLSLMGAVILPPMPAFYNRPESVNDIVNHTVTRVLDQLGLAAPDAKRWGRSIGDK